MPQRTFRRTAKNGHVKCDGMLSRVEKGGVILRQGEITYKLFLPYVHR
jgi:hypothetical protein